MRKTVAILSGLAMAVCLSIGLPSTSEAAPASGLQALQVGQTSLAENAHARRYYHCHRRCWRTYSGRYQCRRYCHRGYRRW
jgi:hypothetical protein